MKSICVIRLPPVVADFDPTAPLPSRKAPHAQAHDFHLRRCYHRCHLYHPNGYRCCYPKSWVIRSSTTLVWHIPNGQEGTRSKSQEMV